MENLLVWSNESLLKVINSDYQSKVLVYLFDNQVLPYLFSLFYSYLS